jgi:hypothetical protein
MKPTGESAAQGPAPELMAAPLPAAEAIDMEATVPRTAVDEVSAAAVEAAGKIVEPGAVTTTDNTQGEGFDFTNLLDPNAPQPSVEDAAVRPPKLPPTPRQEVDRQMGIARADRQLRKEAGLPPRTFDLR